MPQMTGGQALVQQLKMEGIDTIFGLPGIQLDWAFDAIYEERDHFKVYWTRHEQATRLHGRRLRAQHRQDRHVPRGARARPAQRQRRALDRLRLLLAGARASPARSSRT